MSTENAKRPFIEQEMEHRFADALFSLVKHDWPVLVKQLPKDGRDVYDKLVQARSTVWIVKSPSTGLVVLCLMGRRRAIEWIEKSLCRYDVLRFINSNEDDRKQPFPALTAKDLWCGCQVLGRDGLTCTAHMHDGHCFVCPYVPEDVIKSLGRPKHPDGSLCEDFMTMEAKCRRDGLTKLGQERKVYRSAFDLWTGVHRALGDDRERTRLAKYCSGEEIEKIEGVVGKVVAELRELLDTVESRIDQIEKEDVESHPDC